MHVFTSVTANYLPKASALAHSLKRVHPEAVFHVVLCDEMPADAPPATMAPFDTIINIRDLPIQHIRSWIFKHRLVELCTAVKGCALPVHCRAIMAPSESTTSIPIFWSSIGSTNSSGG